jgi:predicted enzyme related to lactoylglutathione lyase
MLMKRIRHLLGVLLMCSAVAVAQAGETEFEKLGVYVVAADLERSVAFYTAVFQKPPYMKTERFAAFDVAGGLFAVFATAASDIPRTRGNSTVPYIRVADAAKELQRIAKLDAQLLDEKPIQEGPLTLFRFFDPDGNTIEFFSLAASPR